MKIEITKQEQTMLKDAIEVKQAAVKRAANTEKNEAIKAIRQSEEAELQALKMKVMTQELIK